MIIIHIIVKIGANIINFKCLVLWWKRYIAIQKENVPPINEIPSKILSGILLLLFMAFCLSK